LVWAVDDVLADPERPVEDILARFRRRAGDEERLRELVQEVAGAAGALNGKPREVVLRWAMGPLMGEFRGRAAPGRVRELLEEALAWAGVP